MCVLIHRAGAIQVPVPNRFNWCLVSHSARCSIALRPFTPTKLLLPRPSGGGCTRRGYRVSNRRVLVLVREAWQHSNYQRVPPHREPEPVALLWGPSISSLPMVELLLQLRFWFSAVRRAAPPPPHAMALVWPAPGLHGGARRSQRGSRRQLHVPVPQHAPDAAKRRSVSLGTVLAGRAGATVGGTRSDMRHYR